MSLINRMLQDLEARQSGAANAPEVIAQIRTVQAVKHAHGARWIGAGALLLSMLAAGWWWLRPLNVKAPATPPIAVAPLAAPASAPVSAAAAEPARAFSLKLDADLATVPPALEAPLARPAEIKAASSEPAPVRASSAPATRPAVPPPERSAALTPRAEATLERNPSDAAAAPVISKQVKELTPTQRAENEYRKANALIQQGKVADASDALEQALQLDPQHKAVRQTLAGLLLQQKRPDEALRVVREGLRLDPNQPVAAMTLARLLVDKGDPVAAVEVLQAALPSGGERADFQAFLAALLQRRSHHVKAIEHYQAALRKIPQNGVWWMGLGISLQAENRMAEAQDAYGRAKASNSLTPELLAFVEQKIKQVQR